MTRRMGALQQSLQVQDGEFYSLLGPSGCEKTTSLRLIAGKVLLLDEPLGALDLKLRKAMQLELKNLQEEVGITFIYVTVGNLAAVRVRTRAIITCAA